MKTLSLETDGDREPKDVYLVDELGSRVATLEGHSTTAMRHDAIEIAKRFNQYTRLCAALNAIRVTLKFNNPSCLKDLREFLPRLEEILAKTEDAK